MHASYAHVGSLWTDMWRRWGIQLVHNLLPMETWRWIHHCYCRSDPLRHCIFLFRLCQAHEGLDHVTVLHRPLCLAISNRSLTWKINFYDSVPAIYIRTVGLLRWIESKTIKHEKTLPLAQSRCFLNNSEAVWWWAQWRHGVITWIWWRIHQLMNMTC
jgi:hypothetical protein